MLTNYKLWIDGYLILRVSLRFEQRLGTWLFINYYILEVYFNFNPWSPHPRQWYAEWSWFDDWLLTVVRLTPWIFLLISSKATSTMYNEKKDKYSAAVSRNGHQFMPFVLDKFGSVLEGTKEMMYRMLKDWIQKSLSVRQSQN